MACRVVPPNYGGGEGLGLGSGLLVYGARAKAEAGFMVRAWAGTRVKGKRFRPAAGAPCHGGGGRAPVRGSTVRCVAPTRLVRVGVRVVVRLRAMVRVEARMRVSGQG